MMSSSLYRHSLSATLSAMVGCFAPQQCDATVRIDAGVGLNARIVVAGEAGEAHHGLESGNGHGNAGGRCTCGWGCMVFAFGMSFPHVGGTLW